MTAELFTVATQNTSGWQRLQASLSKFNVPVTVLGQNEPEFWGLCWKWKTFVRAARQSSADTVIHCDAYDSVCLQSLSDVIAGYQSFGHPIVFSYEPQEQPEPWLALNSGLLMADKDALATTFNDQTLDELFPDHFNDQYQLQSMFAWKPATFALDTESALFHTLGPRSPELVAQSNKLVNPITGKTPSFVHAPNKWDLSRVEQWLAQA